MSAFMGLLDHLAKADKATKPLAKIQFIIYHNFPSQNYFVTYLFPEAVVRFKIKQVVWLYFILDNSILKPNKSEKDSGTLDIEVQHNNSLAVTPIPD